MEQVKAIVLFANPWRMQDEKTGQMREGITVEYVMADNLSPVTNEDGSVGHRVVRESMNINNAPQIIKVPGIYEMTYGFNIRKGKPVMKLMGMQFVSEYKR